MRWTERVPSRRKLADAAAFLYVLAIAVMSTRYLTPLIDDTYIVSRVPAYGNYFFPPFSMMTLVGFRGTGLLFELLAPRIGADTGKAWLTRVRAGLTFAAALAALVVVARSSELQLLSRVGPPDPEMAYVQIGRYLKQHAPRSASVGAMEIGIIGYLSESKIVDFAGLVSRGVMPAVAAGKRRYALDVFRPDYVVVRYPIPLTLEGGLTEGELTANYQFLFGAGGVGVFRAVRARAGTCPPMPTG
jgi:hypothetical protein